MKLKEIFDWVLDNWGFCAFILGFLLEVTPGVKVNPISKVFRWIGRLVNGVVLGRLDAIDERLDQQRRSIDENEMDRIRWEVLDFANACRNGVRHTKDEFQHIIALNEKYHKLLEKYDEENGVFDIEYAYILELYHRCCVENDFL